MSKELFIRADEVAEMLGISVGASYGYIRGWNEELKKQGYTTIAGRVSRKYFMEKIYGMEEGGVQDASLQG